MVQFKKEEWDKDKFRDTLATIDEKGKRVWVYAKKPKGKLTTYRNIFGLILLVFFFAVPFIKINGQPMLLLNFIERKIVILGVQFWPQDFHLFFLAMVAMMVFIILFTVTYGRLWCGWACPQTVFMEIIFRRIEYWIEGDAYYQKKLARAPWNFNKISRKVLKHGVFYLIAFIISNFFLAYIIGVEALGEIITDDPRNQITGLASMLIFSGVFYFIFSWFREQVCTIVCPYGRLQGVLLDKNSIVVSYDYQRGEPRGTFRKGEDRNKEGKGDCVNCTQCVQVCPTGIDIRNGTQLECINCACCIDACNKMMESVDQPKGLIRYASDRSIAEGKKIKFNARTIAYSFVLLVLIGIITYSMTARSSVEATVLRAPGMLYQDQGDGKFSNLYNIKMVNKTNEDLPISVKLLSPQGEVKVIGEQIMVKSQSIGESVFFIILDEEVLQPGKMDIRIGIYSGERLIEEAKASFVGPN
jgi:cytochrome c oxidase accessory protein FixG